MRKFDLIVFGTGPASHNVVNTLVKQDKKILIVDPRPLGGTCALRGCSPKKAFTNSGDLINRINGAQGRLFSSAKVVESWPVIQEFKKSFTDSIPAQRVKMFADLGIEVFHGEGRFTGHNTIEIGGEEVQAERIFVGSGARPVDLNVEGAEHAINSDEFLDLSELPESVVFVGGGFIAMEFAQAAVRNGRKVTVIQRSGAILRQFESQLVEMLTAQSEEAGIKFAFNSAVSGISKLDDHTFELTYEQGGENLSVRAGLIVQAAGRTPNIDGLELEKANVEYGKRGISVNKYLQSVSNPIVFSGGDCADTGIPQLSPVASEDGKAAAKNIFAETPAELPKYGAVPSVVFTSPALASVGLTEQEASKQGLAYKVNYEDMTGSSFLHKLGYTSGASKIIISTETDQILGAHILSPGAEDAINIFALAINQGISATAVRDTVFTYPTLSARLRKLL